MLQASRNKTQLHGAVVPEEVKTERRALIKRSMQQNEYNGHKTKHSLVEHRHVVEDDLPVDFRKVVEKKRVVGDRFVDSGED